MIPLKDRAALTVLLSEPQRHYHTLTHVQHCLREYYELCQIETGLSNDHLTAMEIAIWFHDAVYDPRAKAGDNERDSQALAGVWLRKNKKHYNEEMADMVNFMISATAQHAHDDFDKLWYDSQPAIQYFLDIDLSILGALWSDYQTYAKNIALEYGFVPKRLYAEKRIEILKLFLSRDFIYNTKHFQDKYEKQARDNIQWEINQLSSQV